MDKTEDTLNMQHILYLCIQYIKGTGISGTSKSHRLHFHKDLVQKSYFIKTSILRFHLQYVTLLYLLYLFLRFNRIKIKSMH